MIYINLIILALYILLKVKARGYEKEFVDSLDEKEYPLKALFPIGLYIVDHLGRLTNFLNLKKQEESLKAIYLGQPIKTAKRLYLCNKLVVAGLILLIFNILSIFSYIKTVTNSDLDSNYVITRPDMSGETKTITLNVYMTKEDLDLLVEEIDIQVMGRKYADEELSDLIIDAKTYIDSNILLENSSIKEIVSDINMMSYIPDTDLYIQWEVEDYDLISRDGKINNEGLGEKTNTWVQAIITYEEVEVEYKIDLIILPKIYSEEEIARGQLIEELEEIDYKSSSESSFELPKRVNDMDVFWEEKQDTTGLNLLLMGLVVAILMVFIYDKELYNKVEERNRQMLLDYPEIINKISLLLGAGMPLKNAWHKIAEDYKEKGGQKRYAYEEMMITSNELMLGTSEVTAYENFGRRVKLLPYLRFSSLIAQNVKKGSGDLIHLLEIESIESFEERKELSKSIGEEAGTKLLFPMMIMLLIVLVIVIVPAFLSFQL